MKLLVIESPSLIGPLRQILQRYQPDEWHIVATGGHLRTLPSMKGREFEDVFDVQGDFAESWIVDESKKPAIEKLAEAISAASVVYLATSPSREGEANAWHIKQHFGLENPRRALLHSICYRDVIDGLDKARFVSPVLVDAQRARVAIDYLVGMEVSRRLWRIGAKGIGRLQGCILRLIVDREQEVRRPQSPPGQTTRCVYRCGGREWSLRHDPLLVESMDERKKDRRESSTITEKTGRHEMPTLAELARRHRHVVASVSRRITRERPPLPLTTASLISIAAARYGMAPATTTAAAQALFERGLITCQRSDSPYLPKDAAEGMRAYIGGLWPKAQPDEPASRGRRRAGDSDREAIRPSVLRRAPKEKLPLEQELVYQTVFERTLMSQGRFSEHYLVTVTVEIEGTGRSIVGQHIEPVVAGWKQIDSEFEPAETGVVSLEVGDELDVQKVVIEDEKSPNIERFTEASLIEYMAEHKLGRASTYLGIVGALAHRGYVVERGGVLVPTELGMRVDEVLRSEFDDLFREDFTSNSETCLEAIAAGRLRRQRFLAKFYERFLEMRKSAVASDKRQVAMATQGDAALGVQRFS